MPTSLTSAEKRHRARLVARGAWQTRGAGQFDDGSDRASAKVQDGIDRIDRRGEQRWEEEAAEHASQVRAARSAVASAKVALRTAKGSERSAARREVRDLEQALKRAEAAARKHGLRI